MSAIAQPPLTRPQAPARRQNSRQPFPRYSRVALDSSDRLGIALIGAAIIGAALASIAALVLALGWRELPFPGAMFNHTLVVDGSRPISSEMWDTLGTILQRGDHIVGIGGISTESDNWATSRELYLNTLRGYRAGDALELTFLRALPYNSYDLTNPAGTLPDGVTCLPPADETLRCTATITLQAFPTPDFVGFFVVPFVCGVVMLILAALVLILRYDQPGARMVALGLACFSVFLTAIFDLNTTYELIDGWIVASQLGAGAFIALALTFPTRTPLLIKVPILRFVPALIGLGSAAIFIYFHQTYVPYSMSIAIGQTAAAIPLLCLAVLLAALLIRRRHMPTLALRDQANTVVIGVGIAFSVGVLWFLNVLIAGLLRAPTIPLNTSAAAPFFVIPALSMAYAVLQYRSADTERLISTFTTYTIMLLALALGYFLVVYSISLIAGNVVNANDPLILALIVFVIAILFVPVRTRIQAQVDQLFFRTRHDFQTRNETFARTLSTAVGLADVLQAFRLEVDNTLQPQSLFIFLPDSVTGDWMAVGEHARDRTDVRFTANSGLLTALARQEEMIVLGGGQPWDADLVAERARLNILGARAILALRTVARSENADAQGEATEGADAARAPISGFVVLGESASGRGAYTLEEMRYLQGLTAQISIAVERAQAIETLERRVRELDVLGQVSQAANFTIAYDALLELIATQTTRLVPATHLYITLRERESISLSGADRGSQPDALYHALFLEDDERLEERENRRWAIGRDPFSEVVRTARPLRLPNFGAQATLNDGRIGGDPPRPEDRDMRAWMGVPMLVGTRVIGVLSVGTTDPGRTYTDDQLEIFSDIAALAATSLDKASLFDQTNARARQLTALNEISRQLVAAEADLEGLLLVITRSSVDILGGEAGSLLLVTDDGTNDLEFQIAVGESGASLKGVRVPAGRGLVGEVATSGRSIIVNDVSNDPRWGGEFAAGTFRTTSVLAVPLITPDRIIGVLEVLNKRGGAPFTGEDVDLLTTFAGQAAVAIENARLFQLTDQQLSQRVRELETLEQIDVELNRSLDLLKVASITVGWAMTNTGASAALLGLIAGDPPHLDVVFREGYGDDDVPTDAQDTRWPLKAGAIRRALRSRQPQLVADVLAERDNTAILRNARAQIALPMLSGGTVNAILFMETTQAGGFRIADLPFLQRLTEHASIAITNAQLYAELARANESKSEFVSFVAHELKNPITSIKGYSDFLLNGALGGISDQQKNFVATIRGNADRMNTIVSDLNDVTKLETNNMRMELTATSLNEIIAESIRPFEKQIADKEQVLVVDAAGDLPPANADANRIIQVLTNLVSNAHKYSPPEGTITVSAFVDFTLRDARGNTLPPMLHVQVRDTGIGMSATDVDKLFSPYFRSDNPAAREQPGTGLGLTITRGIIERHGGTIWVESTLGAGTTFHFTLPLAAEAVR